MATKVELEKKIKVLEEEVGKLETEIQILLDDNENLSKRIERVKSKTVTNTTVDLKNDYVVLDGKKHDIVLDDTAKELVEAVKKRYVAAEATCVVIDRVGSNR